MYKLQGVLKVLKDTEKVTDKFSKREFVVETQEQYPQSVMFQSVQDKTSMLDGLMEGQEVEVSFNLRGREWTNPEGEVRYFNTLDAWRVEQISSTTQNSVDVETAQVAEDDDVPF